MAGVSSRMYAVLCRRFLRSASSTPIACGKVWPNSISVIPSARKEFGDAPRLRYAVSKSIFPEMRPRAWLTRTGQIRRVRQR